MAKGILSWDFSTGLLGLYNALNTLGFITTVVGTPTANLLVFTGPLCENGTYIRFELQAVGTSSNNAIGMDIGTVAGSTYTPVRDCMIYTTNNDIVVSRYDLAYDTVKNIVFFSRSNALLYGEGFLFCVTDSDLKLACSMQNTTYAGSYGLIPMDVSVTTGHYKFANLFNLTCAIGGLYLEQEINLIWHATNEILMNVDVPAKLDGIFNVALALSKAFLSSTDWVLFGYDWMESTQAENLKIRTFFKVALT